MRIRGKGYITKRICVNISQIKRKQFLSLIINDGIELLNKRTIQQDFDIISVSGSKYFEEQIMSILSFVENVGVPQRWTVYSDGTYDSDQQQLITDLFPFLKIELWTNIKNRYPTYESSLYEYTSNYDIGRKTFTILNYISKRPFLYCDSDIVFYPRFKEYLHLFNSRDYNYYSVDTDWCCLDQKYMSKNLLDMYQLNSGLLFVLPEFNWIPALEYLKGIAGDYCFFDQTSIHLAFFNSSNKNVLPFDPRLFKVEMSDNFKFNMASITKILAIRHYVGPVRHKMWQKGWDWHIENL